MDPERIRYAHPQAFEAWRSGHVRPYWLSAVRTRRGRDLAELLDAAGATGARVEAGLLYPPWTYLCRLAVWLGCDVSELTAPSTWIEPPVVDTLSDAAMWAAMFRIRYHPALVQGTMAHLNARFGIDAIDALEATQKRAIMTAGRALGLQHRAGVTIAEVIADLDAGIAPETRILRARWKERLSAVWAMIAGQGAESNETPGDVAAADVTAWVDSSVQVRFSTSHSTRGTVTVTMDAHQGIRGRVPLPEGEAQYWMPVLFSPTQVAQVLHWRDHATGDAMETSIDTECFIYTDRALLPDLGVLDHRRWGFRRADEQQEYLEAEDELRSVLDELGAAYPLAINRTATGRPAPRELRELGSAMLDARAASAQSGRLVDQKPSAR